MHQARHASEGWHPCRVGIALREDMGRSLRWGDVLKIIFVVWLAALFAATPAHAQKFPEHGGSAVVDQANLLTPQQEAELATKSQALLRETGYPFVVATVPTLDGLTIEDYGYRLGRHWGLGTKDDDNGVILLVAPAERKVRIETGYGAEGVLPDIINGRIIRDTIIPRFKAGDMPGGIIAGADAINAQLRLSPEQVRNQIERASAQRSARETGISAVPVIFIVIVFFVIIGSIARASGGRRYHRGKRRRGLDSGDLAVLLWGLDALSRSSGRGGWGGGGWGGGGGSWGGGGGGGFSGFGGGSFGGGGASGSW